MTILRIILNVWAILTLFIGLLTAFLGEPIWAMFPLLCAVACSYSSSLIDEIVE